MHQPRPPLALDCLKKQHRTPPWCVEQASPVRLHQMPTARHQRNEGPARLSVQQHHSRARLPPVYRYAPRASLPAARAASADSRNYRAADEVQRSPQELIHDGVFQAAAMKHRTHQWSDSMLLDQHPTQWCRHQRGLAWQEAPPPRRRWSPVQYAPNPAKRQHAEAAAASTSLELAACCAPARIAGCLLPPPLRDLRTFAVDQRLTLLGSAHRLRHLVRADPCAKPDRNLRKTRCWYGPRDRLQTTPNQRSLPSQSQGFQAQWRVPRHGCWLVPTARLPLSPLPQPALVHDQQRCQPTPHATHY